MTWQAVIALLWSIFGPAITELIKRWLDDLLNRAAKSMTGEPGAYGDPAGQRYALFTRAIALHDAEAAGLWFWQKLPWGRHTRRRRLLEQMRERSSQTFLTLGDENELRGLSLLAA